MQRRTTITPSEDTPAAAWAAAMRMLGRRELSTAQVRERLARRGWAETAIEPAIARLAASGALDAARVARACARTRAGLKQQGRDRVLRGQPRGRRRTGQAVARPDGAERPRRA